MFDNPDKKIIKKQIVYCDYRLKIEKLIRAAKLAAFFMLVNF